MQVFKVIYIIDRVKKEEGHIVKNSLYVKIESATMSLY